MHELSIAISMIDQVAEESESRGGLKVEAVHLKLGLFSGVDKAALLFAYEMACEGTTLARVAARDRDGAAGGVLPGVRAGADAAFDVRDMLPGVFSADVADCVGPRDGSGIAGGV